MPYRFSPIASLDELRRAVEYTAERTSGMCETILGKSLPIHSLTIFSHGEDEYAHLASMLATIGTPFNENNGPRVTLFDPIVVGSNIITHLRIRKPDPERPQVGCNDFDVADYAAFKDEYLAQHPDHLVLIVRPTYEMIEFRHPDYDVLAYVVSA